MDKYARAMLIGAMLIVGGAILAVSTLKHPVSVLGGMMCGAGFIIMWFSMEVND